MAVIPFEDADFIWGQAGIAGTGITAAEKTSITSDLTALKAVTYVTQTASATTSAEQALSTLATGLLKVTTGTGVLTTAVATDLPVHTHTADLAVNFLIDGGSTVITTGIKGDLMVPFAATITTVTLLGDQAGSLQVAVWNGDYTSYPPTSASTLLTVTITAPANKRQTTALSIPVAAGAILRFNVNSATTITRATCILTMARTI